MLPSGIQSMRPVIAVLVIMGASVPVTLADDFVTAQGRSVTLPEIDGMTCDQMNVTLTAIDLTRYRENAPTPHHDEDQPLFSYEKKLARMHFHSCVMDRSKDQGGNDLRTEAEKK